MGSFRAHLDRNCCHAMQYLYFRKIGCRVHALATTDCCDMLGCEFMAWMAIECEVYIHLRRTQITKEWRIRQRFPHIFMELVSSVVVWFVGGSCIFNFGSWFNFQNDFTIFTDFKWIWEMLFVVFIYTSNLYMIRLHGAQGKKT